MSNISICAGSHSSHQRVNSSAALKIAKRCLEVCLCPQISDASTVVNRDQTRVINLNHLVINSTKAISTFQHQSSLRGWWNNVPKVLVSIGTICSRMIEQIMLARIFSIDEDLQGRPDSEGVRVSSVLIVISPQSQKSENVFAAKMSKYASQKFCHPGCGCIKRFRWS